VEALSDEPSARPSPEPRAFWLRAVAAEQRGDCAEASRAARWLPRLEPESAWAWLHAGEIHVACGDAESASLARSKAAELDPAAVAASCVFAGLVGSPPTEAQLAEARSRCGL
jgi:predicted Zn-dependent protease